MAKILKPDELSKLIGVSVPTLAAWRKLGIGPVFVVIGGRKIGYSDDSAQAWLKQQECRSTAEAKAIRKSA